MIAHQKGGSVDFHDLIEEPGLLLAIEEDAFKGAPSG